MMKLRFASLALLAALLGTFVLAPQQAAAAPKYRVTGAVTGSAGEISTAARPRGTFEGTFEFLRFAVRDGEVVAVGLLNGVVRDEAGRVVERLVDEVVRLPVTARQATCEILTLTLGPLDLNLLGLRVQLNRLNLRITAESGPGNLLGNLLCDVAGLLDDPTGLARLLNRIFSLVP